MIPTIREATPLDVDALLELQAETGQRHSRDRWQAWCLSPESPLLLCRGTELLAFAVFSVVLDEATLVDIAVHPRQRGRGLGRLLLRALLQRVEQAGSTRCLLEVRASNRPARGLYQSEGFIEDGVRVAYYPGPGGREDAILMSRSLRGEA